DDTHEVQCGSVHVNGGRLIKTRNLRLEHGCDRIFVTNLPEHEVRTLATDGTVLHSFTDPTLKEPRGIHVTALGQVLVCGYGSDTILQIDSEGKKKLATLATTSDGVNNPMSVCYNKSTASLIVGQSSGNNILLLRVK
ncbi:hypothetical protein DPMN_167130, partial [Dreissena polymorpha]